MRAHVIVLSSPGSHLRRISHDYERIERLDLMLDVVVFTIFFYLIFPHVQILIITKKNKTFCNNIGLGTY